MRPQKGGIEIHAHQAAVVGQGLEHLVGQIPPVVPKGTTAGMAGQKRPLGVAGHVPEAVVAQVGHIGDHAQAFHLFQKRKPRLREAPRLTVGLAQFIGIVPGQGEHPHPHTIEGAEQGQLAQADAAFLHRQQTAELFLPAGSFQISER